MVFARGTSTVRNVYQQEAKKGHVRTSLCIELNVLIVYGGVRTQDELSVLRGGSINVEFVSLQLKEIHVYVSVHRQHHDVNYRERFHCVLRALMRVYCQVSIE